MHALLARQLKRFFKGERPAGADFEAFVQAIDQAYESSDADRALMEHSLELSSRELGERFEDLQRDIEARKAAESERDAFFRMSPDMLCIVTLQFDFVVANPSWTRQLGYAEDELVGRNFLELVHPDDQESTIAQASSVVTTGSMAGFQNRYRAKDGGWRYLSWTATVDLPRGLFFGIARDVTEQRALERDQSQAQKLEAVGQLASGMAHEINTPVQFIGDNVQFVADSFVELTAYLEATRGLKQPVSAADLADLVDLGEKVDLEYLIKEVPRSLSEAKDGVRRVAELVRALKEYAHPDTPEMAPADINEALRRTLVLARNELKYVAAVETDLGALPAVFCHIGSLHQVFLNLLVNAAHAIEDKQKNAPASDPRGGIHISTRAENDDVVISIRDSGCGISAAVRERMFEPFFTTKGVGRGSGQGLPLVRSVVEKHQGHIDIDSELGVGTTFILRLPSQQKQAA